MSKKNAYLIPFILVTSLFFLWGIANSLNGILINHFRLALDLQRWQSGLVDTAFYLGYFVFALPAGMFMEKRGFKQGILVGLVLYAVGALLFFPAAELRVYGFFLFALFTIACGLAFLETAANPYAAMLGDPAKGPQRLNLAQSFNGLSLIFGPLLGSVLILSEKEYTPADLATLPPTEAEAIRMAEAQSVQTPYLVLAGIVLFVALLFWLTRMPEIKEKGQSTESIGTHLRDLFRRRHLLLGVLAQLAYMCTQACIWGYFIDFKIEVSPDRHLGMVEGLRPFFEWLAGGSEGLSLNRWAGFHLSFGLLIFMVGRFAGTALMSLAAPRILLAIYAVISFGLMMVAIHTDGLIAVGALVGVFFFQSIMFPTIFALATQQLGPLVKLGSSLVIMAIVGGAIFPPLLGLISDLIGNVQIAFWMPAVFFLFVFYYGWKGCQVMQKPDEVKIET